MTAKERWTSAASIGLPLIAMTAYLLWIWPRPEGSSVIAQTGPYVLSLLTGVPFVWSLTGRSGRGVLLLAFLAGGFILLWLYVLAVLCGRRKHSVLVAAAIRRGFSAGDCNARRMY